MSSMGFFFLNAMQQPTERNPELFAAFAGKLEGGADKKLPPNLKSYLNVNDQRY